MKDLIRSSALAVLRRWRRNLLTLAAIAIGAASLVAVVVSNQSSAQTTAEQLNGLESVEVLATLPRESWEIPESTLVARAAPIQELESIGTVGLPDSGTFTVSIAGRHTGKAAVRASTVVATEQGLKARDARLLSGGYPSDAVLERDPAQVLLGAVLAKQLGVDDQPGSNQLLVNGRVNTVSGLLQDGGDRSILSTTVTMSPVTANYLNLMPENRLVIVRVSPGAAERVAEVLPEFIDPAHVDEISLGVAPSPAKLREQLLSGTRALVIVIAAVMSGATLFGIVTTMQIAAWERRREIGLNRALGSSRAAIALGFLTESMMLGTLGTFVGYLLGILFGASISTAAGWILCVPTWTLIVPIAGAIAGAAAGAWPAWGATRIDPAELLRST